MTAHGVASSQAVWSRAVRHVELAALLLAMGCGGGSSTPDVCTAGATRCTPDTASVELCDAGKAWIVSESCAPEGLCSGGGVCVPTDEGERSDAKGANDTFADAVAVPVDEDLTGYLGQEGDVDTFQVVVAADGVLTAHLKFIKSPGGIEAMMLAGYTDPWDTALTGINVSDADSPECVYEPTRTTCPDEVAFRMSVAGSVGTYLFMVADQSLAAPGFDAQNPYLLRFELEPGATLESTQPDVDGIHVGDADSWRTAYELAFAAGGSGATTVSTYGYYELDLDWIHVKPSAGWSGWIAVDADAGGGIDDDPATLAVEMSGALYARTSGGLEATDLSFELLDPLAGYTNCPLAHGVLEDVQPGSDLYLRMLAWRANAKPYRVTVSYGSGHPEDTEPGPVGAASTAATAYALPLSGNAASVQAYAWYYGDWDWYRITTPPGPAGTLKVSLDLTEIYQAHGWYDAFNCLKSPDGVVLWLYLFDAVDADLSAAIARSYDDDVPTQQFTYANAAGGKDYYILVASRENGDRLHPYKLDVAFAAP